MNKKDWQKVITQLEKDFGANCKTKDVDDFKDYDKEVSRCASCQAKEFITFIRTSYLDE